MEKQRVTELTGQKEELQLLHKLLSTELQGLREEVKTVQDNKVELWHTNCQQLLTHDEEMFEKEREIKALCDRLHRTEMELATLKFEKLSEGTQSSVSQSICGNSVGLVVGGAPLGLFGQDCKLMVATLPVWSAGSEGQRVTTTPLFQSGIYTTAHYTQPTLPRVLPSIQLSGERHRGLSNQLGEQVTSVSTVSSYQRACQFCWSSNDWNCYEYCTDCSIR